SLRLSGVAYMLAGFAVEVLMKARLVHRGNALDSKGVFRLRTHDLLQLAADTSFKVSDDEARLLERLTEYAVWAGRYPIPLTSEAMRPRPTPGGGFASATFHFVGEDWGAIRDLAARLRNDCAAV